jgi:hypothetical protein
MVQKIKQLPLTALCVLNQTAALFNIYLISADRKLSFY